MAQVDAQLLSAAQEVHGEQQVAFLNEIYEAYRISGLDKNKLAARYEREAQTSWLDENPIMVISVDDNLNNTTMSVEDVAALYDFKAEIEATQIQNAVQNAEQTADQTADLGELVEESILIPDEDAEKNEENENGDNAEENNGDKKKTIKFNI